MSAFAHPSPLASAPPSRPLGALERVWLVADRAWPSFVNQLVVEGKGALDADAWRAAVQAASPLWPGARARLHGALGWTRWVADGPLPRVVTLPDAWDGLGPAPFTESPLDPWRGPISEIVLLPTVGRVVIRTHHGAFDGRAAWAFSEDLGAALRGEPVRGAAFAGLSDVRLAGPGPSESAPAADASIPSFRPGAPRVAGTTWGRRSLGAVPGPVLPRVLAAFARAAFDPSGPAPVPASATLRVSLPVDLRRHLPDGRACANLTGFVRLSLTTASTAPNVATALTHALSGGHELEPVRAAAPLQHLPIGPLAVLGRAAAARALRTGLASTSASVSNLGRQDPAALAAPGFTPHRLFWIPPGGLGTPIFVTLTGNPDGVELVVGMARCLAGDGRLDALLDGMVAGVRSDG